MTYSYLSVSRVPRDAGEGPSAPEMNTAFECQCSLPVMVTRVVLFLFLFGLVLFERAEQGRIWKAGKERHLTGLTQAYTLQEHIGLFPVCSCNSDYERVISSVPDF